MRAGWEIKTLGEVSLMMADGPFGSNLKKEHYTDEKEVRIIQLSNIGEDGWREENTKYTSFKHLETIKRSEVFPNDIVIAKMMPAGRAIICPNHEKRFVLSSDAVKVQLKKGINLRFVLYSINSPYFREQVYENVAGSGRVRTSLTKLKVCKLRLPSLPEQQRIVSILDQEFARIDALKANAEKSLQAAKDLFQATLKKELEPKEGWLASLLPDVSENLDSKRIPITKSVRNSGCYPYYGASGIVDYVADFIFDEPLLLVSEDGANLLARSTPIAFSIDGKCWVNNHAHVLRFDDKRKQKFVELWFAGHSIASYITGTAQPKLTQKALNSIPIHFPKDDKELDGILSILEEMSMKCLSLQENYQKTLTLCDGLKQALLRKAFNGEL